MQLSVGRKFAFQIQVRVILPNTSEKQIKADASPFEVPLLLQTLQPATIQYKHKAIRVALESALGATCRTKRATQTYAGIADTRKKAVENGTNTIRSSRVLRRSLTHINLTGCRIVCTGFRWRFGRLQRIRLINAASRSILASTRHGAANALRPHDQTRKQGLVRRTRFSTYRPTTADPKVEQGRHSEW